MAMLKKDSIPEGFISAKEASEAAGVCHRLMLEAVHNGKVTSYREVAGRSYRYYVNVEDDKWRMYLKELDEGFVEGQDDAPTPRLTSLDGYITFDELVDKYDINKVDIEKAVGDGKFEKILTKCDDGVTRSAVNFNDDRFQAWLNSWVPPEGYLPIPEIVKRFGLIYVTLDRAMKKKKVSEFARARNKRKVHYICVTDDKWKKFLEDLERNRQRRFGDKYSKKKEEAH